MVSDVVRWSRGIYVTHYWPQTVGLRGGGIVLYLFYIYSLSYITYFLWVCGGGSRHTCFKLMI